MLLVDTQYREHNAVVMMVTLKVFKHAKVNCFIIKIVIILVLLVQEQQLINALHVIPQELYQVEDAFARLVMWMFSVSKHVNKFN